MNRADQIVDALLGGSPYAAPAPTAPPKPTTKPAAPPAPAKPRPGTKPWSPSRRPGVSPKPKARNRQHGWVGENDGASVPVPPAAHDEVPQAEPEPVPLSSPCDQIRVGDQVTILTPQNQQVRGRAVMRNRQVGCWVLNAGGAHGRPVIADEENIVSVRRGGKVIYGK